MKRLNSARNESAGVDQRVGSYEIGTIHQKKGSGQGSSNQNGQHVDEGLREQSGFAAGGLPVVKYVHQGAGSKEQQLGSRDSGLPAGWTNVYYIESNRLLGDLHWEREHRQEQWDSRG